MKVQLFLIAALVVCSGQLGWGQEYTEWSVTHLPQHPTDTSIVLIQCSGITRSNCCGITKSVLRFGHDILVDIKVCTGVLTVMDSWKMTDTLGTLDTGWYSIRAHVMLVQRSFNDTIKIGEGWKLEIFDVVPSAWKDTVCKTFTFHPGWSLVSVPFRLIDSTLQAVFPETTTAYAFDNTYVSTFSLLPGKGYWIKLPSEITVTICGLPVRPRMIPVKKGWNLVGAFDGLPVSSVTSTPPGIILLPIWGFENCYTPADTVFGARGYWVKVSDDGVLDLTGESPVRSKTLSKVEPEGPRFEVKDAAGNRQKLFLREDPVGERAAELPPLPPLGVFDVRYEGNTLSDAIVKRRHRVQLQSVVFPLAVKGTSLNHHAFRLRDELSGTLIDEPLREGKDVIISKLLTSFVIEEMQMAPDAFALSQNYPNPFNPKTVISCQWPVVSDVKLVVYDLLGQVVGVLIDGVREPGRYEIPFDATNLASGVYIYRLTAGSFTAVHKMAVVR